jgi:ABC-type molybdenum transport system ATPase subunit/photorepair protein PhrA
MTCAFNRPQPQTRKNAKVDEAEEARKKAKKDKQAAKKAFIAEVTTKGKKAKKEVEEPKEEEPEPAEDDAPLELLTKEERLRKERPPPRVRITESQQPGFVSMKLSNVGVVFRNQEVLKDATWDVKTGERVGLVGANGTAFVNYCS